MAQRLRGCRRGLFSSRLDEWNHAADAAARTGLRRTSRRSGVGARGFSRPTPAEEARAVKQASLSFYNFAPAIGPSFVPGRYPQLEKLFLTVRTNITEAIDIPKDHWQRQRPYELDETLQFGRPERCPSYPSGHAARGVVQSFLLAELFPDKREAILAIGREIGWDRVLIGKHFPTDIAAGRVLGKAIVRELMANPTFQRDWAAVKAEVEAVRQTANHAN